MLKRCFARAVFPNRLDTWSRGVVVAGCAQQSRDAETTTEAPRWRHEGDQPMPRIRRNIADRLKGFVNDWSLPRQLAGESPYSTAAQSTQSKTLRPRLEEADTIGTS